MSRSRMSRSRLAKLSHAQLVELAAEACEGSRELKNKADALIAKVEPVSYTHLTLPTIPLV